MRAWADGSLPPPPLLPSQAMPAPATSTQTAPPADPATTPMPSGSPTAETTSTAGVTPIASAPPTIAATPPSPATPGDPSPDQGPSDLGSPVSEAVSAISDPVTAPPAVPQPPQAGVITPTGPDTAPANQPVAPASQASSSPLSAAPQQHADPGVTTPSPGLTTPSPGVTIPSAATPVPAVATTTPQPTPSKPVTQYQGSNTSGTNSSNDLPQSNQTGAIDQVVEPVQTVPNNWVWNWTWNCSDGSTGTSSMTPSSSSQWTWNWSWDCGPGSAAALAPSGCSGCNTTISVRVLSPGDDGPVTQSIVTSSTSVAEDVSSALQLLAQTADTAAPSPPAAVTNPSTVPILPVVALPPATSTTPASLSVGLGAVPVDAVDAGPTSSPDGPAEAAPVDQTATATADGSVPLAPPSVETAPQAGLPSPLAQPASGVTVAPARVTAVPEPVPARGAVHRRAGTRSHVPSPPDQTVLAPAPLASVADRTSAGYPAPAPRMRIGGRPQSDGARRHPPQHDPARAPIPQLPSQGTGILGGTPGSGGGSSGVGLMALIAAFVFLSPDLTRWLRVGRGLRPRLLRAGRRERPG